MRHRIKRIAVALARTPVFQLAHQVGRWLSGERRVACAHAPRVGAMAHGAGLDLAHRIPLLVEAGYGGRAGGDRKKFALLLLRHRERGVVVRDLYPRAPVQARGNPAHLRMAPLTCGEIFELTCDISRVESGEPGREVTIALPLQTMAGDTGSNRARITARKRDELTGSLEHARRNRLGFVAGGKRHQRNRCQRLANAFVVCTNHSIKKPTTKASGFKAA
ncbi:hypothetical protein AEB_P0790 [Altererythrobacter sp. B11]|nr:hypothetical protein [Altererythrobacter sp. B11]BBC71658.1 hypothetical protein AEB_P0790 [Altererythrobacter sp. B11]